MKEKTPKTRARELYQMVYGKGWVVYFDSDCPKNWIKLGRLVLSLERRLAKAKARRK